MAQRRALTSSFGSTDADNLFAPGGTMRRAGLLAGGTAGPAPQEDGGMRTNPGQSGPEGPAVQPPPIVSPPIVTNAPGGGQPAPSWQPGAKAGQNVTLLGFDNAKLDNPNYTSKDSGKYGAPVRTFYQGLKQDVGLSRGGLDNMINYLKSNGFAGAQAVGDDKIDFGDGQGPIDVIRSDGQIVFQNTTGNPVWEKQRGVGGGSFDLGNAGLQRKPAPAPGSPGDYDGGSVDPFAAMGGGVKLPGGGWVPKDHPLAAGAAMTTPPAAEGSRAPVRRPANGGLQPISGGGQQSYVGPGPQSPEPGIERAPEVDRGVYNAEADAPELGADPSRGRLDEIIQKLLTGDLNQSIIDRRVDQARGVLDKQRKSAVDTLGAQLAERGQGANDGSSGSASMRLDTQLNDDFANEVSGIYANEAENADNRMLQALAAGTDLSVADMQAVIDRFEAQTGRQNANTNTNRLGLDTELGRAGVANDKYRIDTDRYLGDQRNATDRYGIDKDFEVASGRNENDRYGIDRNFDIAGMNNATERYGIDRRADIDSERNRIDEMLGGRGLDLQGRGQELDWNKFAANFGLDREKLMFDMENNDIGSIIQLLQQLYGGAGIGQGGYI